MASRLDVLHENDADHYDLIGHFAPASRAKTGVLAPELNRSLLPCGSAS